MLPPKEPEAFRLLILGDGTVRTIPLRGLRWVIGRAPDCTVTLRDVTVSRRHLLLERRGEAFMFQDLGGANAVLLDGRPMKQGEVKPGQTLSIGLTRLVVESRPLPTSVVSPALATVVLSREILDEELVSPTTGQSHPGAAAQILERIEWTFADLGDLSDAAEPLLSLALDLTGRRTGFIARLDGRGELEPLSSLDLTGADDADQLPAGVLGEIRRIHRPQVLSTREGERSRSRLVIPLGKGPEGIVVLENPTPEAPNGQELLRLAQSLGAVFWHRLQETTERMRLRSELQRMQFHGTAAHNALLTSTRLHEVRQALRTLAGGDRPALLCGEDGTEREDLARYLHAESPRQKGPFVALNATRLKSWQHEKELFGDGRGTPGAMQRASGGTLFLDDVTGFGVELQQRLVTELRQVALAGETPPAFLVLASSTAPTAAAANVAAANGWAPELLDWIASPPLEVPPLRSDARDVLALAELFLSAMGACPDGSPRLLTERSKRLLVAHSWPGNVRELRLVLEAAAASAGNQPIAPRHLPPALLTATEPAANGIATLEEVERMHIAEVMQRTGGNRAKAAQLLGIATSTLYDKLKRMQTG